MPIAVGTKAFDFTLKTSTGEGLKDVRLSDPFGIHGLSWTGDASVQAEIVVATDGGAGYAEPMATPKDLPHFAAIAAAPAK
jgi:hypothetical protein